MNEESISFDVMDRIKNATTLGELETIAQSLCDTFKGFISIIDKGSFRDSSLGRTIVLNDILAHLNPARTFLVYRYRILQQTLNGKSLPFIGLSQELKEIDMKLFEPILLEMGRSTFLIPLVTELRCESQAHPHEVHP